MSYEFFRGAAVALVALGAAACCGSSGRTADDAGTKDAGTVDAGDAGQAAAIDPRFRGVPTHTRFKPCSPFGLVGGISPGLGPDRTLLNGPCFVSGLAVADGFHTVYASYDNSPTYEASIDSASSNCGAILQDVMNHNRVITAMGGDVFSATSLCEIIAVTVPGVDPKWSYSTGTTTDARALMDTFDLDTTKQGFVVTGLSTTDAGLDYVAEARTDLDAGAYETLAVSTDSSGLAAAAASLADGGYIITASTSDGNDVSAHTTFWLVGTRHKGVTTQLQTLVAQMGASATPIADGMDAGYSLMGYLFDRNATPLPDGGINEWWIVMER